MNKSEVLVFDEEFSAESLVDLFKSKPFSDALSDLLIQEREQGNAGLDGVADAIVRCCKKYQEVFNFIFVPAGDRDNPLTALYPQFTTHVKSSLCRSVFNCRRGIQNICELLIHLCDQEYRNENDVTPDEFMGCVASRYFESEIIEKIMKALLVSEKAFAVFINRYLNSEKVDLSELVTLSLQHPNLAHVIINKHKNKQENIEQMSRLVPNLKAAMKAGHLPSLETYVALLLTGALSEVQQNIPLAKELCRQLIQQKRGDFVVKVARAFSMGCIMYSLGEFELDHLNRVAIPLDKIFAYMLYHMVIDELGCSGQDAARNESERAVFLFKVADCYAKQGELSKANELYQGVLGYASSYFSELEQKPEYLKKEALWVLEINGNPVRTVAYESKMRIAMIWNRRLEILNEDPRSDLALCFELSEHYFQQDQIEAAARCLAVASAFDEQYSNTALYKALEEHMPEEVDLEAEKLLSRVQILEFVKPYYEVAKACGHPDAERVLQGVEQELYSLKHPEKCAPIWG